MNIYRIDKVSSKLEYCLVTTHGNVDTYEVTNGLPVDDVPEDFRETQLSINEDKFGLELTDLLGSTNQFLMLEASCYERLAGSLRFEPIETHRFRLLDARGRVHSDDYLIVNPLESHPCMSRQHSDLLIDEDDGEIIRVRSLVLEANKLPPRDLFRVAEDPMEHLVTQQFVDAVAESGFTNFSFEKVPTV